jgi:hypothetical protein
MRERIADAARALGDPALAPLLANGTPVNDQPDRRPDAPPGTGRYPGHHPGHSAG